MVSIEIMSQKKNEGLEHPHTISFRAKRGEIAVPILPLLASYKET